MVYTAIDYNKLNSTFAMIVQGVAAVCCEEEVPSM